MIRAFAGLRGLGCLGEHVGIFDHPPCSQREAIEQHCEKRPPAHHVISGVGRWSIYYSCLFTAQVRGNVFEVSAVVTDDVGVVQRQLLLDGSVQATLFQAPHTPWLWTRQVTIKRPGAHVVRLRANHGSGNFVEADLLVIR